MAPKTTLTTVTSSRPTDITDTSMANISSNADTKWLRENMQQLIDNQVVIKEQLDTQKH